MVVLDEAPTRWYRTTKRSMGFEAHVGEWWMP